MNILKEFAKIFIKSKLDDEKRKLKDKLQKQIITTTSTSVVARNVAYLGIVDKLDGKGIAEVNKIIGNRGFFYSVTHLIFPSKFVMMSKYDVRNRLTINVRKIKKRRNTNCDADLRMVTHPGLEPGTC